MGLSSIAYDTDRDVFNIDGVKAGDASEMETKLNGLIAASANPDAIADMMLAGTEQGPEWEAQLQFGDVTGAAVTTPRATARAFAGVGGSGPEAYANLKASFAAFAAGGDTVDTIHKLEISGGGDGSSFMALALATVTLG